MEAICPWGTLMTILPSRIHHIGRWQTTPQTLSETPSSWFPMGPLHYQIYFGVLRQPKIMFPVLLPCLKFCWLSIALRRKTRALDELQVPSRLASAHLQSWLTGNWLKFFGSNFIVLSFPPMFHRAFAYPIPYCFAHLLLLFTTESAVPSTVAGTK